MQTSARLPLALLFAAFLATAGSTNKTLGADQAVSPDATRVYFPVGRYHATLMGLATNWMGNVHKNRISHLTFIVDIDQSGRISADVDYELPEADKITPDECLRLDPYLKTLDLAKEYVATYYYRIRFELRGTIDPGTGRAIVRITDARMETGGFREHSAKRGGCDIYVDFHHEFDQEFRGWLFPGPKQELLDAQRTSMDQAAIDRILAVHPNPEKSPKEERHGWKFG